MPALSTITSALAAWATLTTAAPSSVTGSPRYSMYFDQYHTDVLPNKTMTAGITHVITAFANSSLFTTNPVGEYTPFKPLSEIRAMFDHDVTISMAVGGWGDLAGFRVGVASEESRALYASNIAATLNRLGYDGVDIDWEYPGGNGFDYKQIANNATEAEVFPLFLTAIKSAIGDKELSIAVPGLERDMLAYTAEKVPLINSAVDVVNVMTYDLMNRRDTTTKHHTDIKGSLNAIDLFIERGMKPAKMNLGIAFYAKYFTLAANTTCTQPIGCPIALAEAADGSDTGASGADTFEASSFPVVVDVAKLTVSTDGSCGSSNDFKCTGSAYGSCCSQYGWCGNTTAHCSTGCQNDFGTCTNPAVKSTAQSFQDALTNGQLDSANGGQWYVDDVANLFWTWDTPELITRKFREIIAARGLGGIMAWSLAEDSVDWRLLEAMQEGFEGLKSKK
ncbi:glycoside hydrolase, family 18 [Grosmannia clavigera kw1407]|uniref:chitinase n=1 Tax=Grosmannia clavigera (strain kw1407 / UAMH 11150) TaxID=655863 RepID=F0XAV6_GROCL|nr:glycoside hydrolase, family 18 [Grosmannia clavigera kw1407]EFX05142.1 glycoside hydrolase, family 18 [Grosmannia clavigera kw1407]